MIAPALDFNKKIKPKKYLILTSSGGGGHINAAEARKNELVGLGIKEDQIDIVDVMGLYPKRANKEKPWVPTYSALGLDPFFSGKANTDKWDKSQREGTEEAVRRLEYLVEMQPLAEAFQSSEVKKNLLQYLYDNDVQDIFNTQALSTPAICQAVVEFNQVHQEKPLRITTTVTDLITHRAEHFLNSLKNLTHEQKKVLTMETSTLPMTDPAEKSEDFLKKYGVSEGLFVPRATLALEYGKVVRQETEEYTLPVKQEYKEFKDKDKIIVKAGEEDEKKYLEENCQSIGQKAKIIAKGKEGQKPYDIVIDKAENDKLITITMGSQGSNSVIEYMDAFKQQLIDCQDKIQSSSGNIYLCIAAGKAGSGSLYEKVKAHAAEIMKELPENLRAKVKILPLAFQDANHMASLLNNSDVLITRSGGMSAMEAKATYGRNPNRQVYVHSEAKLKYPDNFPKHSYDATYEALMTGTVKWEGGNAEYLLREVGASLGSPETVNFGFSLEKGNRAIKENSLFHFAYDGKLNNDNLTKIEQLIREGSNPNLRFAGGSYLIDHCKDFHAKKLLVKYGARITDKCLVNLNDDEKKDLNAVAKEFKLFGSPKVPLSPEVKIDKEKEQKAYSYLYPFKPKNLIEKLILSLDKAGDFIKSKVLKADYFHDAIDATRMYLRTDPTEQRNVFKRLKQLRNFTFDATVFIAKQPVNMITKPIALTGNLLKAGLVGLGMVYNEAKGEKSNISSYANFKETGKKALSDLKDSLIAWGSAALVFSGFGAPVVFAVGGTSASITLGAANFGAANAVSSALNSKLVEAAAYTSTPAASAVLTAEGIAEWGIVRPFAYFALNPKKLFYQKDPDGKELKLSSLGQRVQELHKKAANPEISIEIRREARKEMDKILNAQKIEKVVAPVVKGAIAPLRERR